MKPPVPQTRLNTSADAIVVGLKVQPALLGLTASSLSLLSEDGSISLKVPSQAFPHIQPQSGEILIVSITVMRNVVEPIEGFEAALLKGMDS